jgi:tyrosyl-tRNA synthetase
MSKSKNNAIGLTEPPNEVYGKVMSIPDSLIEAYLELAAEFDEVQRTTLLAAIERSEINPMEVKKGIAFDVVRQYHGVAAAEEAAGHFYRQVQNRDLESKEYQRFPLPPELAGSGGAIGILDLCTAIEPDRSRSELRRLLAGGGVTVDGDKLTDPRAEIPAGWDTLKLKIGKRGFYEVVRDGRGCEAHS